MVNGKIDFEVRVVDNCVETFFHTKAEEKKELIGFIHKIITTKWVEQS